MDANVNIKFLGGLATDDNSTGSCILLTIRQEKQISKVLVDVGLIQASNNLLEKNKKILDELQPSSIDAIVLTHSHIDHIGRLPFLVKHGFSGRIFCTKTTNDLLSVMLEDSAKIQVAETNRLRRTIRNNQKNKQNEKKCQRSKLTLGSYDKKIEKERFKKNSQIKIEPLYTMDDVEKTCDLVKNGGYNYNLWIKLAKNVSLKFYPSGHVLGGAICAIRIKTKTKMIYFGFSGDLGRRDGIILPPPEIVEEPIDYWFIESTYGGRVHPDRTDEIFKLLSVIRTTIAKNGKIIIPSFALERTQEILYLLAYYIQNREIPNIPIYLDSPLASKITNIFSKCWLSGMFLGQSKLLFNPFNPQENKSLNIIENYEDSEALVNSNGPYIVIAGSGMCDAGRVREHLRYGLNKPKTTVCLVGYMAKNSLGRKLKDGLKIVKMNKKEINIKANIVSFDSFSAHADSPYLVSYTLAILARSHNKKIFIVHGEEDSANHLKADLIQRSSNKRLGASIVIPGINFQETIK